MKKDQSGGIPVDSGQLLRSLSLHLQSGLPSESWDHEQSYGCLPFQLELPYAELLHCSARAAHQAVDLYPVSLCLNSEQKF